MKRWMSSLKNIYWLTQLGFSLVMPLLLCIGLCWALTTYVGLGNWVYIPGFILGLGSSASTAYSFYRMMMKKEKKNDRADNISFNSHE